MCRPNPFSTAKLPVTNLISQSPMRGGFAVVLIPFLLACFALSPRAQAVTPAPDGGYPNGNTAEGDNSLFSLTSGTNNTALGSNALLSETSGRDNTATGASALLNNHADNNTADGFQSTSSQHGRRPECRHRWFGAQ